MSSSSITDTSVAKNPGFFHRNRIWFLVIFLFAASNAGVYYYQKFQQDKLRTSCREVLDTNYKKAETMTAARNEEIATDLCRTLVFGIRGEMERGNRAVIDLFLNKMVQESGLDLVIIQNAQDSIYISTDKKFENHVVPYIQGVINAEQILKSELGEVVVAAPIMGSEERLGTCLVVYKMTKATEVQLQAIHQDTLPGEGRSVTE